MADDKVEFTKEDYQTFLALIKHAWDTGVVRDEGGAAKMVALRQKVTTLLANG